MQDFLHVILCLSCWHFMTSGMPDFPGLKTTCDHVYYKSGDIKLGMLFSVHKYGGSPNTCSDQVNFYGVRFMESWAYGINAINEDPDILTNISLGWVMLDACGNNDIYLTRSFQFLPQINQKESLVNGSPCSPDGTPVFYYIAALLGPGLSSPAMFVSHYLGQVQMPVMSLFATSDELSDKSRFPYFIRLTPPDRFQAEMITDVLVHFNWSYISLIFSEGPYGESGAKYLEKQTKEKGICIEVHQMIPSKANNNAYETIVHNLMLHKQARVVVLFMGKLDQINLLKTFSKFGENGHFIWILSDSANTFSVGEVQNGAFTVFPDMKAYPPFNEWYKNLTPKNNPNNPWMDSQWENLYNCKWNKSYGNDSCFQYEDTPYRNVYTGTAPSKFIDGAKVFALALDELLKERCPEAFINKSTIKGCIDGEQFLSKIKEVTFEGASGLVKFDENGDMLGSYILRQYIHQRNPKLHEVIWWNKALSSLDVKDDLIDWSVFNTSNGQVPESVCSKSCGLKEYMVPRELPCCWVCKSCRQNEIIVSQEGCEPCNETEWPDEESATKCIPIPPTYLHWNSVTSISLTFLCVVGIITCFGTSIIFYHNRNTRLIKATSRELSGIILLGTFLAYITVFAFLAKPSDSSCLLNRVGFNISVSLIYSPLLVKTNRIYRIFTAGRRGVKASYIRSSAQLALTGTLVLLQVMY